MHKLPILQGGTMRKALSLVVVVTMLAIAFAGCSGNSEGSKQQGVSDAQGETKKFGNADNTVDITEIKASGTKNGNVTMGPDSEKKTYVGIASRTFETLDPFYLSGSIGQRISSAIYEPLWDYEFGADSECGILVKDWTISDDGFTVDAILYEDIYDWEGNHITASDIEWYYNQYLTIKTLKNIKSLEATGEYSFKMEMTLAYFPGMLITAAGNLRGVSQAAYEADPDRFVSDPVGTGPYRCIEFISGNKAVFEQTYKYWGDFGRLPRHRQANVDVVGYNVILESSQKQTAIETNTIQLTEITTSLAENVSKAEHVNIHQMPQAYPYVLMFNCAPGSIFENNLTLRQAIAYGIDWNAICYSATAGTGIYNGTFGYNGISGYDTAWEHKYYEYNLDKAKELLREAGYSEGELTLRFVYNSSEPEVAVPLQASLMQMGIKLELQMLDEAQYLTARNSATDLSWDLFNYGSTTKGFIMNVFKAIWDNTLYDFGALCGTNDEEMNEIMLKALYDQTPENLTELFDATMEKCMYIPQYQGFDFIAAYDKIESPVRAGDLETMAQASIFADDYDVYYNGQ